MKILLSIWFLIINIGVIVSQSTNQLKLSGGLQVGISANSSNVSAPIYSPFGYQMSGQIVGRIFGFSVPLSIYYSDNTRKFSQPFTRVGMSPKYKKVKIHLGHRNIRFGEYSLAGNTMFGVGVEFNPSNFRLGIAHGKLNSAVKNVEGIENIIGSQYDRIGTAYKIGFGNKKNSIDLSFLSARDEIESSIRDSLSEFYEPAQENAVIEIRSSLSLSENINMEIGGAASAFNDDIRSQEISKDYTGKGILNKFFIPRINSDFRKAIYCRLTASHNNYGFSLEYKRIDPDFKSMGAYRFYTDLQNLTINPNFSINNKVRFNGTLGIQSNNLTNRRLRKTNRFIGRGNLSFQWLDKASSSISYSNFRSNIISTQDEILSDSFNIIQISEQLNLNTTIQLGGSERRRSVNVSTFLSEFSTVTDLQVFENSGNKQYGISCMYSQFNTDSKSSWNVGLNYNNTSSRGIETKRISMRTGMITSFTQSIRINASILIGNTSFTDEISQFFSSLSTGVVYQVAKTQTLNFRSTFYLRKRTDTQLINNLIFNLNYGTSF